MTRQPDCHHPHTDSFLFSKPARSLIVHVPCNRYVVLVLRGMPGQWQHCALCGPLLPSMLWLDSLQICWSVTALLLSRDASLSTTINGQGNPQQWTCLDQYSVQSCCARPGPSAAACVSCSYKLWYKERLHCSASRAGHAPTGQQQPPSGTHRSICAAFWRLRQFAVMRLRHVPPQLSQHRLHRVLPVPAAQHVKVARVHHAIRCDAAHLDARLESHLGRLQHKPATGRGRRKCQWQKVAQTDQPAWLAQERAVAVALPGAGPGTTGMGVWASCCCN